MTNWGFLRKNIVYIIAIAPGTEILTRNQNVTSE